MTREDDLCPPLEGHEQEDGLDPETKKQKIHQPTLVDTLYARVLGATAVTHGMYSFETELECYLSEAVIERSDMVKEPMDDVWQLTLQLKDIVEMVCAQRISLSEVAYLDVLIQE
ncbi:hypothetical protein QQF64_033966 [Cirrhinus molitorella]|uniref:Uncharacterized protein n=1 Tax=Cirrhinus molitorella TaxID=172907 RepID=A0ABR3MVE0_9TELE